MMKNNLCASIVMTGLLAGTMASAATILPDPNAQVVGADPGEKMATLHDDFYVFSSKLNTQQGYAGFDGPTGTGGLDVIVYTGAGGANNVNVTNNGSTFTFEDPMDTPSGGESNFAGIWGMGNNPNGPVLVDDVLAYLHTFDPNNSTPVFNFDMNQVGNTGGSSLDISGQVTIWDPALGGSVVKSWAFDNLSNDVYDPAVPVTAPGTLVIPGLPVTFDNNLGSGKADYVAYAPTMSLADWTGKGYLFLLDFRLAGLRGGFEELYLTGSFVPGNPVPEPATMLMMLGGLLGLGVRRKMKK
jgi:hypothetical protein